MYHSPNRWGESHKTAVTLIKARFLTSIVGNQARRCDDVPPVVLQPPEILKASTLWQGRRQDFQMGGSALSIEFRRCAHVNITFIQ